MSAAPTVRSIAARDLPVGDIIVFENFVRGQWVTVESTATAVEHLVTIDWRRVVSVQLDDAGTPIEYAGRAPLSVR